MLHAARDSPPSFERVYRAHYEFVWRTLRALGVTDSAVDDAAQDVFVVVHRRLDDFEGRASVKTWLYEITRRVAMRYRSRAANDAVRTFELPDLRAADDLDAAVDRAMAAEVLRAFVGTLDEDRQRAFILAEFWEMGGREIAEVLDVNMNTVYARLRSARTDLDRMARRLQARNVGALTRVMRTAQPSPGAKERTFGLVIAKIGMGGVTSAGASMGLLGAGALKWGAVAGVAALVAITTVAAVEDSSPAKPAPVAEVPTRAPAEPSPVTPRPQHPFAPAPGSAMAAVDIGESPAPHARIARRPGGGALAAGASSPSLTDELQHLKTIRSAVGRSDHQAGRASIESYRQQFAGGALRSEVDALEVELSCRVSAADAAQRVHDFRRKWPSSHLVDRLERICGSKIGPQNAAVPSTP